MNYNGMLATGTEMELHGISPEIGHTVAVVKKRVGSSSRTSLAVFDTGVKASATAKYSMTNAATALQELGVPLVRWGNPKNPVRLMQDLFKPNRFMGMSLSKSWHATTVIPINAPTKDVFVIELDSLTGNRTPLSLDELLELLLKRWTEDEFEIYEIKPGQKWLKATV